MYCETHRTITASRYCIQCGKLYCPTCVVPKEYGRTALETCPGCGGLIRAFDPAAAAEERGQVRIARRLRGPRFYTRPWRWLAYPFSARTGVISMAFFGVAQAAIFTFARTSIIGFLGWMIFHGLVLSFLSYVVRKVDMGEEVITAPTEFEGVWDDVYRPFLAMVLVTAPLWASIIIARGSWMTLIETPLALGLFVYGLAVLPGAILWATHYGGFFDLINPWKHLSAAWRAPVPYLMAILYTVAIFAIYMVISRLLRERLPIILGDLLDGFAHVYFGLVGARMYGLLLRDIEPEAAVTP